MSKSKAKKMNRNRNSNNRIVIMRLLLTQGEREILERAAEERTGGNMSEYVRRQLFPKVKKNGAKEGANDEADTQNLPDSVR